MKKRKTLLYEIALFILAALLYSFYELYVTFKPQNPYIQMALYTATAVVVVLLFMVMRKIWQLELKSALAMRVKALITKVFNFVIKYANKWNLFGRQGNELEGKVEVRFDFSGFKAKLRKRERFIPPKWKDMKTAREKMGFLYYSLITEKMRKGMRAKKSDTPIELKHRTENNENEKAVFDMYINARYDMTAEVDEGRILDLKEQMFD